MKFKIIYKDTTKVTTKSKSYDLVEGFFWFDHLTVSAYLIDRIVAV